MDERRLRIAIHRNDRIFRHSGQWIDSWIEHCRKADLSYEVLDCFQSGVLNKLQEYDCLLWHVGNYVPQEMMAGRSILQAASNMGLAVFPDFYTAWHFDDKLSETYLLQSAGAPIPKSWMFYLPDDCIKWLNHEAIYPLVAKLRSGSGSHNVKLLHTKADAVRYARRMFGRGYKPCPSLLYKATSQYQSARDWETMKKRMARIPEFLHTLSNARMFPRERGYVLFQEFVPNDGYDLKIVVVGDKLSFIARSTRKGDFRASGGGDLFYDRNLVTEDIITSAFATSDKLGFQCMGYDYVVDSRDGKGKIVEISYGFSHTSLLSAGCYCDRSGVWHDEPLNAPEEVIQRLIESCVQ